MIKIPSTYSAYAKYHEMLVPLEKGFTSGSIRDAIREALIKSRGDQESLECLFYIVDRLYPNHLDMVEKLMVLR